ncbi:MAG: PLDc N-terminal domain-containing protein [Spirochaetales bacterium]|nr:PLDc N-terminal domain-containing protein [Spirochaetales bacterium]
MNTVLLIALVPLVSIELILKLVCFLDWRKREVFRGLDRWVWLIVFLLVNLIGPIVYLAYGRSEHGNN